ncbi:MAG: MATE family efflux transporter [Candidatus Poribacteria bacterium]|nr:MATE family efflux transporter [Candidatus Poribacteria bacterium]
MKRGGRLPIGRRSAGALALRVMSLASFYAMHILIAQKIGRDEYGLFAAAFAAASLIAAVGSLGLPAAAERFTAQYVERQKPSLLIGLVARSQLLTCAFALAAGVLTFAAASLPFLETRPALRVSLQMSAFIAPVAALLRLQRRAYVGLERVKTSFVGETIAWPALTAGAIFAVPLAFKAVHTMPWLCGAGFLIALFQWKSLRSLTRRLIGKARPEYETRTWLRVAAPSALGAASQIVMQRAGIFAAIYLLGEGSAGLYGAAQRIASLIALMLYAVRSVAAPMFASSFYGGKIDQFRHAALRSMAWSFAGAVPFAAAGLLFPEFLMGMFGGEFRGGAVIVRILVLGQLVNAATGPVGTALQMTGNERAYAAAQTVFAALNLGACAAAATHFDLIGIAVAASCGRAALNAWLFLKMRRIWTKPTAADRPDD